MNDIIYYGMIPLIIAFSVIGIQTLKLFTDNLYYRFEYLLTNIFRRILLFIISIPVGALCFVCVILFVGSLGLIPAFIYLIISIIRYIFTGDFKFDM